MQHDVIQGRLGPIIASQLRREKKKTTVLGDSDDLDEETKKLLTDARATSHI